MSETDTPTGPPPLAAAKRPAQEPSRHGQPEAKRPRPDGPPIQTGTLDASWVCIHPISIVARYVSFLVVIYCTLFSLHWIIRELFFLVLAGRFTVSR